MADETVKQTKEAAKAAADATAAGAKEFTQATETITQTARKAAEQGATNMRTAYDSAKSAAETATDMLEETFASVSNGWARLNQKALDGFKAHTDANFALAQALLGVRTPAEAFQMQANFARERFQDATMQAQEFAELASDIAAATGKPAKETMVKTMKSFTNAA